MNELRGILSEIFLLNHCSRKKILITIAHSEEYHVSSFIHESEKYYIANIECTAEQLEGKLDYLQGLADYIFIDETFHFSFGDKSPILLTYSDSDVIAESAFSMLSLITQINNSKIYIVGNNYSAFKFYMKCSEAGGMPILKDIDSFKQKVLCLKDVYSKTAVYSNYDIAVYFSNEAIHDNDIISINNQGILLLAGKGSLSKNAKIKLLEKECNAYRLDVRETLISHLNQKIGTHNMINNVMGRKNFEAIKVVAGGFIGDEGDIVLDSINNPKIVIGIADGGGGLKKKLDDDDMKKINTIKLKLKLD